MFIIRLLLFTGLWTISFGLGHYVFLNESKTWAEAQRYCREKHTDLVTIENKEDVQRMTSVTHGHDVSAWIRLRDDPKNWKWSSEGSGLDGDGDRVFRSWWTQPDNSMGRELCVYLSLGKWHDFQCNRVLMAVCYDGRANVAERYVLLKTFMTWSEAQEYCREHHTDLASVRNDRESHIISHLVGSDAAWIGLHRTMSWSDMSKSSFMFWGRPTELQDLRSYRQQSCVAVWYKDSGGWTELPCDNALPFICYNGTSSRVYRLEYDRKSWPEAQKHCREKYTDLATVDSAEDMDRLMRETHRNYNGLAWIGLYDDILSGWRWSHRDEGMQEMQEYWNWNSAQDNTGPGENCVASVMGAWRAFSCKTKIRFICYDDKNRTQRYVLSDQTAAWSGAQSYCRQHYTDLASIQNSSDNQAIAHLAGSDIVWIGLYRERAWSNQSNLSFVHWKSGETDNMEGNQKCVAALLPDMGKWSVENCLHALQFFCYNAFPESTMTNLTMENKDGTGSGLNIVFSLGCQLVALATVCVLLICSATRRNV